VALAETKGMIATFSEAHAATADVIKSFVKSYSEIAVSRAAVTPTPTTQTRHPAIKISIADALQPIHGVRQAKPATKNGTPAVQWEADAPLSGKHSRVPTAQQNHIASPPPLSGVSAPCGQMLYRAEIAKINVEQRKLSEATAHSRQTASKLERDLCALKDLSKQSVEELLRQMAKTCTDQLQSSAASATKLICAPATSEKLPAIPEEVATSAAPHRCHYRNKRRLIDAAASEGNDALAAFAAARPPDSDAVAAEFTNTTNAFQTLAAASYGCPSADFTSSTYAGTLPAFAEVEVEPSSHRG